MLCSRRLLPLSFALNSVFSNAGHGGVRVVGSIFSHHFVAHPQFSRKKHTEKLLIHATEIMGFKMLSPYSPSTAALRTRPCPCKCRKQSVLCLLLRTLADDARRRCGDGWPWYQYAPKPLPTRSALDGALLEPEIGLGGIDEQELKEEFEDALLKCERSSLPNLERYRYTFAFAQGLLVGCSRETCLHCSEQAHVDAVGWAGMATRLESSLNRCGTGFPVKNPHVESAPESAPTAYPAQAAVIGLRRRSLAIRRAMVGEARTELMLPDNMGANVVEEPRA
ncbi:hypothetical protein DFH11DRAFT_1544380 [Phellopilus nigrolimitatus]|nr:hypothetical protein DFH11DRAFT_1544380 [Phellopilus nigrolimitatus]